MNKFRKDLAFCLHMAQGRISPAKILSTDTERVTWLGLCDRFLPGADGFNFKMLFKVCFLSAAPYDSLRWTVQSSPSGRIKVGKGPDQHLFVTMEHFFSFFFFLENVTRGPGYSTGDWERRRIWCSDRGERNHCYLQGWLITLVIAAILHDSLA